MSQNGSTKPIECEALIVGCGPAGSSAGAILAQHGHKVIVLEKEKFPRYHIGESLLPFTNQQLVRLGLHDKMKNSNFVKKYSVQFVSQNGRASLPFYFYTRYEMDIAQTWQVLRSEFDQMLMENTREKGADVREQITVREFIREDGKVKGVRAVGPNGEPLEFRAPMTIDCSGRDSIAASRHSWRIPDPKLSKVAVWTYYKGAKRDAGQDEGATTVAYVPEKGWFWYIPQHRDMVSVGVVASPGYLLRDNIRDNKTIFHREAALNKWIMEHLEPGEQTGPYFTTGEYSYRSKYCADDGLLLAGDAYGFLDPIFSSGVMLALKSGVMAGDLVHDALKKGDYSGKQFTGYGKFMMEGIENMRKLVLAFYDLKFSFRSVTEKYPDAAGLITDCLSGDVNKDFSQLYKECSEFAEIPEALPYGLPVGVEN